MKNRVVILTMALFASLIGYRASAAGNANSFVDTSTPLGQAQQAYLSGDFLNMALNVRKALEQNPNDSVVKENALSLLRKAGEAVGDAQIPVDWHLPDEIKIMNVGVKYSMKEDARYSFRVYGQTLHEDTIAQLQVIQYPDKVVLDKNAGIGGWGTTSQIDTMEHQYELQSDRTRQPVPSGLYLLNLTLKDGTQTKGWFILDDDINSTASPHVMTPMPDEIFSTGNPTFRWQDFVSPQHKPFERRSVWLGVSRSEPPDYKWDEVYGHFEYPPVNESLTLDGNGDPGSVSKLKPGRYVFFIDFHERRNFGDLKVSRDSITMRNFRVK